MSGAVFRFVALTLFCYHGIEMIYAGENCDQYDIRCVHGKCVENVPVAPNDSSNRTPKAVCECEDRWSGAACDIYQCQGRVLLKSPEGMITDGTMNYSTDDKCTWLVEGSPNVSLRFYFSEFVTECSWDNLYIFDGSSVYDPLLAVYSGISLPSGSAAGIPELVARSGSAYFYFYSDAAVSLAGFTVLYSSSLCPYNCSARGTCLSSGQCICSAGWSGSGCEQPSCPNNCSTPNGSCLDGKCVCLPSYRGFDCSIPDWKGVWTQLFPSSTNGIVPYPATSHTAILFKNHMWIMCGYNFENSTSCANPLRYSFGQQKWDEVETKGPIPAARYGHSAALCQNTIYVFGGVVDGVVTSELWRYNTSTSKWRGYVTPPTRLYPMAVQGHTAHCFVNNGVTTMYVIFGHNPVYGYLNIIQRADFSGSNTTWSVVNTTGALVKGSYGHSSVYDDVTGLILVYGGYQSQSFTSYFLSDMLYAFNPNTSSWLVLSSSQQPRYLHSAALIGRLMLVFGGNAHNDTSGTLGAKCYSNSFMAYDIECNEWFMLDSPKLPQSLARFGHSAVAFNDKMYVFGGFDGVIHNDLFVYEPGSCKNLQSECLTTREGTRCAWANNLFCTSESDASARQENKNIMTAKFPTCKASSAGDVAECGLKDRYPTCLSCTINTHNCEWCGNECVATTASPMSCNQPHKATNESTCLALFSQYSLPCIILHNCKACSLDARCMWNSYHNKCEMVSARSAVGPTVTETAPCNPPCSDYSSCENCTTAGCMWCSSQPPRCIESNSYVVSFPYGQCMAWTTMPSKCPETRCSDLKTCDMCHENPGCGWLDDGSNTGLGFCMDGTLDGPLSWPPTTFSVGILDYAPYWYFSECPPCQCNGHSECNGSSYECENCLGHTTGDSCEMCEDGFWGQPIAGGNCTDCDCNSHATLCNQSSGSCFCNTRGIIGERCDQCDRNHKYIGDPLVPNGTCYYELTIDYIFTFNLSYEENKYYTHINFQNTPPSSDKDVDFNITCVGTAFLDLRFKTGYDPNEYEYVGQQLCTGLTVKLSHRDPRFRFGNTTFYVYLYNFTAPFIFQRVSFAIVDLSTETVLTLSGLQFPETSRLYFSQNDHLDLFRFFVTFFSCFFSLLLVAFIAWKLKQRYNGYRRGQRHVQEMAAMASRPFATYRFDVEPLNGCPPNHSEGSQSVLDRQDIRASSRRKKDKCMPVAFQPLAGPKAAIVTVLIRLPTADEEYTLPDQCGLAIGSALVTVGAHTRRTSLDRSTKRGKTQGPAVSLISSCSVPQQTDNSSQTVVISSAGHQPITAAVTNSHQQPVASVVSVLPSTNGAADIPVVTTLASRAAASNNISPDRTSLHETV